MREDVDNIEEMQREETKHKLPLGWILLFTVLVVWGVYYSLTYTPEISGWSQEGQYLESLKK